MASYPHRAPGCAFRVVGDEGALVVLPSRSEVKVLNPTGALIFSMLDGGHTREQISEAVAAEFDVSPAEARTDVDAFLSDLAEQGMLAPGNVTP
jgi:hypothetical protein